MSAPFPAISNGYKLRVTSTPNGKGNKFYELMTSGELDGVWSCHLVDIHTAVADGLARRATGLTQSDPGQKTGLRQPTISSLENGAGGTLESLFKILTVLNFEVRLEARSTAQPDLDDLF